MKAFMKLFYAPIKMIWFFAFNLLIILNHPLVEKKQSQIKLLPQVAIYFHEGGEKRTFYDSENILYFNTIAASNILVPERQKKIQAFYNKLSFAFSSNSKENTPILFNIMTSGVEIIFHDKNIILTAPTLIICKEQNKKAHIVYQ